MNVAFFYSLSALPRNWPLKPGYPQTDWLKCSIESLKKHIDDPQIHIAYTPPYDESTTDLLTQFNTVERPNAVPPTEAKLGDFHTQARRVLDRYWVHELEGYDFIFSVDSDVFFRNDVRKLCDDSWDVLGTITKDRKGMSTRFLGFKNPCHRECNKLWLKKYLEKPASFETSLLSTINELRYKISELEKTEWSKWFIHNDESALETYIWREKAI